MNEKRTHEDEIKTIKKENRKRRKVIEAYQDMINAGATGLHAVCVNNHYHYYDNTFLVSNM